MASMSALDTSDVSAIRERYIQLRGAGYSPDDAMHLAQHPDAALRAHHKASSEPALPEELKTSVGESVARGAAQGATMNLGDEAQGVIQAIGNRVLPVSLGGRAPNEHQPSFAEDYRAERDAARNDNAIAHASHNIGYNVGGIGGMLVTTPLLPAAKGAIRAAVIGGGLGATMGLGDSKADLTKGEVGRAAIDTGVGLGVGAAAGLAAHGVIKGVTAAGRAAADRARDFVRGVPRGASAAEAELAGESIPLPAAVERASTSAAQQVAERPNAPSAIGGGMTVKSALDEAQGLSKYYAELTGKPMEWTPAQATGSRAAALSELRIRNSGGAAMDLAQSRETAQLTHAAEILDALTKKVAADPAALGRPATSTAIADTALAGLQALDKQRAAVADPLYDQFRKLGGRIDGRGVINEVRSILEENALNPSAVPAQLRGMLDQLVDKSRGGLQINVANNLRKFMGQVIDGHASMLDGVGQKAQSTMAYRIRGAVDQVFDAAARKGGKLVDEAGAAQLASASDDAATQAAAASDAVAKARAAAVAQNTAAAAKAEAARTADPGVAVKKLALAKMAQERADAAAAEAVAAQKVAKQMSAKATKAGAAVDAKNAANKVIASNNQRADAINVLRQANAAWAAGTKAIEDHAPATVKRLIDAAASDSGAAESLPARMLTMEDGQVRGIFKLLNKTNPAIARQTRAQMLEEAFVKFGKPPVGSTIMAERGITQISPQAALAKGGLPSMAKAMEAAFEGDPVALNAYRHSILLLERLRVGPNIRGSTTMPQQADTLRQAGGAIEQIASMAGTPSYVRPILRTIVGTANSDKAMAEAMSTAAGGRAFVRALELAFKAKKGLTITPQAASAAASALARAGIQVASPTMDTQEVPPPEIQEPPSDAAPSAVAQKYGAVQ